MMIFPHRSLTLFVATLVSTWYGGILGVGEFYYRWNILLGYSNPYFFASIFALFLQKSHDKFLSIPDKLASSYG